MFPTHTGVLKHSDGRETLRRRLWQTRDMVEREEMVTTPDGEMLTFIFHPEHDGPHPVVLYLMDAPASVRR